MIFPCLKVSLLGWFSNRAGTSGRHKGLSSTSSAQFASQPLVKPVVWFVRTVIEWHSHSIAKSAYYLSDSPVIMCICHNFICCAIASSFYNPVTKVDTENTTYHCFLLRKHLHTCSSAKNKFTDQIYFTNGSKVVFFSRWVCSFLSDTYKVLPKKYLPKLKCLSFFSFLEKKKFSLIFCGLFKWWQKL